MALIQKYIIEGRCFEVAYFCGCTRLISFLVKLECK